jgi:hypothetical protein
MIVPSMDYYLTVDESLRNQYLAFVNAYVDLLVSIDNFYISKDSKYIVSAKNAYAIYKGFPLFKNTDFESYFVTKKSVNETVVYETKNKQYFSILSRIEDKVINKFQSLLFS